MKSRLQPQNRFLEWLLLSYKERLTLAGKIVFWLIVSGNLVMSNLVVKIFIGWTALVSIAVMSILLARRSRAPLQIDYTYPDRITCGNKAIINLNVSNHGPKTAVDVKLKPWKLPREIQLSPADGVCIPELKPGNTLSTSLEMTFTRRGSYIIEGICQYGLYPFGLWADLIKDERQSRILVYPHFHPIFNMDIPVGRRYQPGGIALASNIGESTEFISTREFRQGDNIRWIHWRSWARLGKPVVKEFQEEFFCRIALLLDTYTPSPPGKQDLETFESSLSLAAAIADYLSRGEYVIDLFAAGPEIYHFQAGRSLAYLENVMDILACLEPSHSPPFSTITPVLLECLENITTTIIILLGWDDNRRRMIEQIRDHGSAVKAILLSSEEEAATPPLDPRLLSGNLTVLTPAQIKLGVEEL